MSKAKVQRKRPALTSPPAGVPAELADLLGQVETYCNRAAGIVNAAARAVAGDELTLNDDYVPSVFAIALQRTAGELETLGDLALRARTRTRPHLSPPAPGTP
jgi:hypothetical protein